MNNTKCTKTSKKRVWSHVLRKGRHFLICQNIIIEGSVSVNADMPEYHYRGKCKCKLWYARISLLWEV